MSTKKLKQGEGQRLIHSLLKQSKFNSRNCPMPKTHPVKPVNKEDTSNRSDRGHKSTKKRTPPSMEKRKSKKSNLNNIEGKETNPSSNANISSSVPSTQTKGSMELSDKTKFKVSDPTPDSIDSDPRFKNFSDEFIAFGNMMCVKLNEIVEPLKNSNDKLQRIFEPLQMDMKQVLEERKDTKQIAKVCESVREDQDRIPKKCEKIECENKELKSRLIKLENRMLKRNFIFHGIKEDNWENDDNTRERVWNAIANTVDDNDSRKRLKIVRGIRINSTK